MTSQYTNKGALINHLGSEIFDIMLAFRQQKTPAVEFEGRRISGQDPYWLQAAEVLRDYFIPVDAWAQDLSIVALVQSAIRDIRKGQPHAHDARYIALLANMELAFVDFLQRNNKPIP